MSARTVGSAVRGTLVKPSAIGKNEGKLNRTEIPLRHAQRCVPETGGEKRHRI